MENGEVMNFVQGYLPVVVRSSSSSMLLWPSRVVETLEKLSGGPQNSKVDSGESLFLAISDLRHNLSLRQGLASSAGHGYTLFFDQAEKWFGEVVPELASLLLRLPSLLEAHYQRPCPQSHPYNKCGPSHGLKTSLRLLESQQSGMVIMTQELIGALLACSFFCLFPITNRAAKRLPTINFDYLFASLYDSYTAKQENKIKCITHYFVRICTCMPVGVVSFERKVLSLDDNPSCNYYPKADFWSRSSMPLCHFKVYMSGFIEDQSCEAIEVDFANKYLGGGTLHRGCLQEEIRFVINPELIAGMLFLPSMADNETIEIVGAERFSNYSGYGFSFCFAGDHVDQRDFDLVGRRKTRIIAMDALSSPGERQFGLDCLIREINKAFCGFFDQSKFQQYQELFHSDEFCKASPCQDLSQDLKHPVDILRNSILFHEAPAMLSGSDKGMSLDQLMNSLEEKCSQLVDHEHQIGIATGNWGCGAFGGDPELKATLQWLAASEALRPFISYYTFGVEALQTLEQVTHWILSHEWTVGELWNMLVDYSSQRLKGETNIGFFRWLLPSLFTGTDAMP
ncbi:poly(ADP-ribose) glycohydrolase 1-like isoform X2 [Diospyros lotus]|uniref:poly(ADP-ribose) glycohydrolase 1-like isoform X2 n=1 Tax=Diospyros lotus TaxID=55363 RepID=UPI0022542E1F|nr:poly(ADP-ribose) glycohydrolase 1-like isoform X2 [Diospyros lotus]